MLHRSAIYLNRLRLSLHELYAIAIILFATLLRIVLTMLGWPQANSDEGTMDLMAMHIASRGEHPTFFYGQNYMGSLEAYLGAALFHLFGPSVFTLRLGLILLFALFLVSMYVLTSLLYTKNLALATLIILGLGSRVMLNTQLLALGGYPETLLFGSLAFLLTAWLTLSCDSVSFRHKRWWRYAGYGSWGLVAGLGLWSDLLILPFVVIAGLLLVLFCWHELQTWAGICLFVSFVIGAFPLIVYNIGSAPGQNSLLVLGQLNQQMTNAVRPQLAHTHYPLLHGIINTVWVSIPMTTGAPPLCLTSDVQLFGHASSRPFSCALFHISWGLGWIALWLTAIVLALVALWHQWHRFSMPSEPFEESQIVVRQVARLMLLGSAGFALALYVLSPIPIFTPGSDTRYLIGLLIATPAVLSPLWNATSTIQPVAMVRPVIVRIFSRVVLLLIAMTVLVATIGTFFEVPSAQASNQQQDRFIKDLLSVGVIHIYTDYWTCDRIAFQSREQIICETLDIHLQPSNIARNRYMPYMLAVQADPHSSYVFPVDSLQATALAKQMMFFHRRYHCFIFDGYVVYRQGLTVSEKQRIGSATCSLQRASKVLFVQ